VLRTRSPVRALSAADRDEALALCGRNLAANVFVAARIEEGALDRSPGSILGYREGGDLHSLCWVSANVVPVETTVDSRSLFADRVRRWRAHCASLLGPQDEVLDLWKQLERSWGPERVIRASQPLMSSRTRPSALGLPLDPRVRRARLDEVDLILPAAAHMFAAEIGYPPYTGSSRAYRSALSGLVRRGHTYVVVEGGRVVFKADVGSVSGGCAQVQGVWLAPDLRGRGLSVAMMASVVEQVMADIAPWVTLYVNDFNLPARATYARVGFEDIGMFTTVLL
jgi:predicted GNAT family acetyltransferase